MLLYIHLLHQPSLPCVIAVDKHEFVIPTLGAWHVASLPASEVCRWLYSPRASNYLIIIVFYLVATAKAPNPQKYR